MFLLLTLNIFSTLLSFSYSIFSSTSTEYGDLQAILLTHFVPIFPFISIFSRWEHWIELCNQVINSNMRRCIIENATYGNNNRNKENKNKKSLCFQSFAWLRIDFFQGTYSTKTYSKHWNWIDLHCLKSVRIRILWSVFSCIRTE